MSALKETLIEEIMRSNACTLYKSDLLQLNEAELQQVLFGVILDSSKNRGAQCA